MTILDKNAFAIIDMFFPNSMYSYLLKDPQLELIGMCDKIEIIDGNISKYSFQIKYFNKNLPKGVSIIVTFPLIVTFLTIAKLVHILY